MLDALYSMIVAFRETLGIQSSMAFVVTMALMFGLGGFALGGGVGFVVDKRYRAAKAAATPDVTGDVRGVVIGVNRNDAAHELQVIMLVERTSERRYTAKAGSWMLMDWSEQKPKIESKVGGGGDFIIDIPPQGAQPAMPHGVTFRFTPEEYDLILKGRPLTFKGSMFIESKDSIFALTLESTLDVMRNRASTMKSFFDMGGPLAK